MRPHGRITFAGEYVNKVTGARVLVPVVDPAWLGGCSAGVGHQEPDQPLPEGLLGEIWRG
jgi:hypothetical protein